MWLLGVCSSSAREDKIRPVGSSISMNGFFYHLWGGKKKTFLFTTPVTWEANNCDFQQLQCRNTALISLKWNSVHASGGFDGDSAANAAKQHQVFLVFFPPIFWTRQRKDHVKAKKSRACVTSLGLFFYFVVVVVVVVGLIQHITWMWMYSYFQPRLPENILLLLLFL